MLADHVALQSTLTAQCITTFSTGTGYNRVEYSNLLSHVTIDRAALQGIKNVNNLFVNEQTLQIKDCAQAYWKT